MQHDDIRGVVVDGVEVGSDGFERLQRAVVDDLAESVIVLLHELGAHAAEVEGTQHGHGLQQRRVQLPRTRGVAAGIHREATGAVWREH